MPSGCAIGCKRAERPLAIIVRSHDLFAIEGTLDKKAVIGNPPLRVFVEVVGLAGSLATIMDICGKYRTPPVMVGSAGLVIAWLEFFRRYVMAVGADRRPESRVVLTSLISTRSDSQLFVNGTKVTPTASGTFVACAARL